jgi:uncharacterized damage-inducible protein DinB
MTTTISTLAKAALVKELEQLRDAIRELVEPLSEEEFRRKPTEPGNSAGHLLLHLTGNLSHFVGGQLGKTGYVRDREREFTDANMPPKAEVLSRLDDAVATFRRVVEGLTDDQLAAPHPEARLGNVLSALVHLVAHFALHRGQISYIVRIVQGRQGDKETGRQGA